MQQHRFTTRPGRQSNRGMTLIELLIGMALSMILINGLMAIFASTVRGSTDSLRVAQLSQELRAVMSIMSDEIRRAGHWNAAYTNPAAQVGNVNPHGVQRVLTNAGSECIIYSYDAPDGNNFRAFRINGTAIEWRRSNVNFGNNCNNSPEWSAITTAAVTVTDFNISSANSSCTNLTNAARSCNVCPAGAANWQAGDRLVYIRQIDFDLTATLTATAGLPASQQVSLRLDDSVRVRNDEIGDATQPYSVGNYPCGAKINLLMVPL